MTTVDFHTQVGDKIHYSCRLIRKARAAQCNIIVLGENQYQCDALDDALWSFSATDFLPHVMIADPLASQTAIVITDGLQMELPHYDLLINLSQNLPTSFQRFNRIIEVIASDEDDAQAARGRFRLYQQQGIKPSHIVANIK
jgi:DNA polymerase-3 subunit chi